MKRHLLPALLAGLVLAVLGAVSPAVGIVKPDPPETKHPYITAVEGTPRYGMAVVWSNGETWHLLTRSEHRASCEEALTRKWKNRCIGAMRADYFWLRQMKRSLRGADRERQRIYFNFENAAKQGGGKEAGR